LEIAFQLPIATAESSTKTEMLLKKLDKASVQFTHSALDIHFHFAIFFLISKLGFRSIELPGYFIKLQFSD